MSGVFKLPLVVTPQPEGGYTVTSPAVPELVTEGNTLEEAMGHVADAWAAVLELYTDLNKPIPSHLILDPGEHPLTFESVVVAP
ncbi:MAG: type II toxin-antitoxin system HicB family antitoxin [Nitrospirales bacterium]|nr:type II toxin-antitoxin system HicB family antitoxin [Nitrospirales bacterium]